MNYDTVSLGDVCEFLDNQRVPITEIDRKPGPYPYYGANGQQDSIDNYIFDEPLVLLAEDGGYFGSKDRPIAYKVTGKCWVNNHAHVLRPKSDIDVDYLHRVLSYYDVTKYVNGTTRQKLTKGNAENISFPLPPLTEQKRIASLLARADRLRQLRRTAHDLGDALLQSVFLEMFGDYLNKIECLFGDVLEIPLTNGFFEKNDKYGKGNPIVWVDNLYHTNIIDTTYLRRVEVPEKDLNKYEVLEGDLLFTRSSLVADGVGQANIVSKLEERTMFESHVIRARVDKKKVNPFFALGLFRSQFGKSEMMKRAKTSTMTTIGQDTLYEFPCPLPPLSLQEEFAGVVARVESLRGQMGESARQVEELFESLLAESFREKT